MAHPCDTSVMLLAAGRGQRMRKLGDATPKALLQVGPYSLIEHHLHRLAEQGFRNIVINVAHLADQITHALGNGEAFNLNIQYSSEVDCGAQETAGGIVRALTLLESNPFLVINADIWSDFDYSSLLQPLSGSARLVLVANPPHNPHGDFVFNPADNRLQPDGTTGDRYTFSGIGLYQHELFAGLAPGKRPLAPILHQAISAGKLEALVHRGRWSDVGTPERLQEINRQLQANSNA